MRRVVNLSIFALALFLAFSQGCFASPQGASVSTHKILVDNMAISGTQAIDTAELTEITAKFSGSEFDDDPDELQQRIRAEFQDRGYLQAEIKKFEMKNTDPLASPRRVQLEAEVSEGPRCRVSSIEFTGNHFFTTEELRAMFPLKTGDIFERSKIGGGMQSMMSAVGSRGLLDSFAVPHLTFAGAAAKLEVEVHEGPQYRMGELVISGPAEVQDKLRLRWTLDPGAVFDRGYVYDFIDQNSSLLPANFVVSNVVKIFKDCKTSTASVHIHLTQDAQHEAQDRGLTERCADSDREQKASRQ